jgi:two-component system, OmpR family, sensor kinase
MVAPSAHEAHTAKDYSFTSIAFSEKTSVTNASSHSCHGTLFAASEPPPAIKMREMVQEGRSPLLLTLERLLAIPAANLKTALSTACDAVAAAVNADKVDAFLYDSERDCLVAEGSSNQPLSAKQIRHGLNVLPLSNGGRVVHVYQTGKTFVTGHLEDDMEELRGVRELLQIRSKIGVPLLVGGKRRGMMMIASQQPEAFKAEDVTFAEAVVRWVGTVAHRAELVEQIERNAVEQGRRAVAEELITVLAHDLRNYISPIEIRLRAIRRRAELEERTAEMDDADAALRAVARLTALIADILDAARLDQGVLALQLGPVDLTALVDDIGKALSTPHHAIVVNPSDNLIVEADPERVRQCLQNILTNAIRYSPNEAPVTVLIRRSRRDDRDFAAIEIIDEGPGIPPDIRPHIFERFVTGERRRGGLGLGLFVAKRIATLHNGDLNVQSEPGKGAQFTLSLPCYREP